MSVLKLPAARKSTGVSGSTHSVFYAGLDLNSLNGFAQRLDTAGVGWLSRRGFNRSFRSSPILTCCEDRFFPFDQFRPFYTRFLYSGLGFALCEAK